MTDPIEAALQLERDATAVADALRTISRPSDVAGVIGALERAQQVLAEVYGGLASWHREAELGVHHAGEQDPQVPTNRGWVRAEVALEEAAQYSHDTVAALQRARSANATARWFDEIRADDL